MLSIDLETAAGAKLGSGPLARVTMWQRVRRLDRAGSVAWQMPATDTRGSLLALRTYARGHAMRAGLRADLGLGIVDTIETDALSMLVSPSGDDLLRELAMRPSGPLILKASSTYPLTLEEALTTILNAANAVSPAWTFDMTTFASTGRTESGSTVISDVTQLASWHGWEGRPIYATGTPVGATVVSVGSSSLTISAPATLSSLGPISRWVVFYEAGDESILQLLNKVAEATGTHFRLGTGREVVWLWSVRPSSGIRAVTGVDPVAASRSADLCLITQLSQIRDASDLYSHVTPFGGAPTSSSVRLTLADGAADPNRTTRTAPPGYTLDLDRNLLGNTAALASYGYYNRRETWRNVVAGSTESAAIVAARNQLFDVALEHLRAHSEPLETYQLAVTKLDRELLPGETIRVVYRGIVDGYRWLDIDRDLLILESTTEVTRDGLLTPSLTVATQDRWPQDDTALLIAMQREIAEARAHG